MQYDEHKLDEVVLALLFLNVFQDGSTIRAWKGFDWDSLDRLHEKGFINNPRSKAKSVVFTDEGRKASEELFMRYFRHS